MLCHNGLLQIFVLDSSAVCGLFWANQSSGRSLMSALTPKEKRNEFFGFYAFSGKATAFVGPLLFGWATACFNTQQAGLFVVVALFILGYLLLKGLIILSLSNAYFYSMYVFFFITVCPAIYVQRW